MNENELVQKYTGLVHRLVEHYRPANITPQQWIEMKQDYIQVGFIGLLYAIRRHEPKKGGSLSTGAWYYISWSLLTYIKTQHYPEIPIHPLVTSYPIKEDFWELVPDNLTDKEQIALKMRKEGYLFTDIAQKLQCSKSNVNRLLKSCFKKIRLANGIR